MLRSAQLESWWPTTQSLDLVRGTIEEVSVAVEAEMRRFIRNDPVTTSWCNYGNLDEAFRAVPEFTNVPTCILVLHSHSEWTVLWNNSFLCDGYDSLCACITQNHGLTTVHWSAHDAATTFQPAAMFTHRRREQAAVVERSVYVARQDSKWLFGEVGHPLPDEDLTAYQARRKQDRLNESSMVNLLAKLGAAPWSDAFYALPEQPCFVLRRPEAPSTIVRRPPSEVLGK